MTRTRQAYTVWFHGYHITVPKGARVSESGVWLDYHSAAERLTGFKNSILHYNLGRYGLKIPKEEVCHANRAI